MLLYLIFNIVRCVKLSFNKPPCVQLASSVILSGQAVKSDRESVVESRGDGRAPEARGGPSRPASNAIFNRISGRESVQTVRLVCTWNCPCFFFSLSESRSIFFVCEPGREPDREPHEWKSELQVKTNVKVSSVVSFSLTFLNTLRNNSFLFLLSKAYIQA